MNILTSLSLYNVWLNNHGAFIVYSSCSGLAGSLTANITQQFDYYNLYTHRESLLMYNNYTIYVILSAIVF